MPQQSADLLPSYCTKVLVCVCYHLGRVLKINFFCFQFLQRQIIIWLLNRRTGRLDIYLQLYFKLLFYKKLYFIPSRTTSLLVEERLPARDYHANFINGFGDVLKNQLQTFRHFHLHKQKRLVIQTSIGSKNMCKHNNRKIYMNENLFHLTTE